MVYADQMRRRATDRARYWAKKGLPVPNGNGGSSQSVSPVPEFVPRQEKITGFNSRKHVLIDRLKPHWKTVGYGVAGLVLIGVAALLGYKYQYQIADRLKGLLAVKGRREEVDPFPETTRANKAMGPLLDFAESVMRRDATGP